MNPLGLIPDGFKNLAELRIASNEALLGWLQSTVDPGWILHNDRFWHQGTKFTRDRILERMTTYIGQENGTPNYRRLQAFILADYRDPDETET